MGFVFSLICGYALDLLIGDPEWLPHPVRWMGNMIVWLESCLRKMFLKTPRGEFAAGIVLVAVMGIFWLLIPFMILLVAYRINPVIAIVIESLMCFQILAVKSLKVESMRVHHALCHLPLTAARKMVGRIVGRDTEDLTQSEIARATVETIAENTGDGIVSPLFFMAIGGAPFAFLFKAVNTLDSMVGYRNEKYSDFGKASAKFDDVLNFIPARICALLMVIAAPLAQLDGRAAWRVFCSDRKKHDSPNAAHPEAACAGAMGLALGGRAVYGGKLHEKQTLGVGGCAAQAEDIVRANRLMDWTALFSLVLAVIARVGVIVSVHKMF